MDIIPAYTKKGISSDKSSLLFITSIQNYLGEIYFTNSGKYLLQSQY